MKKNSNLFNIIFLVIGLSLIIYKFVFDVDEEVKRTAIAFHSSSIDIGDVKQHEPTTAQFTFTNIGNEDLIIHNIDTDCHCTAAQLSDSIFAPGESGEITITYDGKNIGFFEQAIAVHYNSLGDPHLLLFRGIVYSE